MGASGTTRRSRDGRTAATEADGARALREWVTGEQEQYARVFLVERGVGVEAVVSAAGRDDLVLLPEGCEPGDGAVRTAAYTGAFRDAGDELFLGERSVELQDYIAAAFVQIIGPTAVRFFDEASWQAFLDDADLARRTGVFPAPLIDRRVLLADRRALTHPAQSGVPTALRVCRDGSVGIGLQGAVIGGIHDLPALLDRPASRAAALGGIAPELDVTPDLTSRQWMARYLDAAELMKMLGLANADARIAGFGWSLLDDGLADADPADADPFLLETAQGVVLADIRTLRRQLLSPLTGVVVSALQTSSTLELAAERIARAARTSAPLAGRLCEEAVAALGVHSGTRPDGPVDAHATSGAGR